MATNDVILCDPAKEPRVPGYSYTPVNPCTPEGAAIYARRERAARLAQVAAARASRASLSRLLRGIRR